VYVFLDFDGVMRRLTSQPFRFDRDCLERFENVLRAHPGARIVVASAWRLGLSLDSLRGLFSADIAPRVVGVTPESSDLSGAYRHREMLGYLERNAALDTAWVVVDDDPAHYPAGVRIVAIDPHQGFDARAAAELGGTLHELDVGMTVNGRS
jgi:hypothetical protein